MSRQPKNTRFKSFHEFYPYYLSEHTHPINRLVHFIGTLLAICLILMAINGFYVGIIYAVLSGYAFAWFGHFFIEKNKPATFKYPIYSFLGDWKMFFELLTLKRPFSEEKN